MSLDTFAIKISNFKCFGDNEQGFDRIKPINVIIGRNNSGKTALLDLIEHATRPTKLDDRGHRKQKPQVSYSVQATQQFIDECIPNADCGVQGKAGTLFNVNPHNVATGNLLDSWLRFRFSDDGSSTYLPSNPAEPADNLARAIQWVGTHIASNVGSPLSKLQFRRVAADRDIVPERSSPSLIIDPNGAGLTSVFQRYITSHKFDRHLIETDLLTELNSIFRPDAEFSRLLVQEVDDQFWELYLEERGKGSIPLRYTGSGLKTVLFVLACLIVVPTLGDNPRDLSKYLFAFEELENNLHPAIQRRLLRYLRERAIKDGCHFFLTTHSNVVIDVFGSDDQAQTLHVSHDGESARVDAVVSFAQSGAVLDDLDVRASDLLQTNAIIWVEGPSDRIYMRKWIELWSGGQLVEGIHYQCVLFGGSLGAHYSIAWPDVVNGLMIPALHICRHAILFIDRDRSTTDAELKATTGRLLAEVAESKGYPWITDGREVENYIPQRLIQAIVGDDKTPCPDKFTPVMQYLKEKGCGHTKVELAHRVASHLTIDDLRTTDDLPIHLEAVCESIRQWNRLPAPS